VLAYVIGAAMTAVYVLLALATAPPAGDPPVEGGLDPAPVAASYAAVANDGQGVIQARKPRSINTSAEGDDERTRLDQHRQAHGLEVDERVGRLEPAARHGREQAGQRRPPRPHRAAHRQARPSPIGINRSAWNVEPDEQDERDHACSNRNGRGSKPRRDG